MLMKVGSLIEQFRFDVMKPIYDVTIGKAMHKTELSRLAFRTFWKKKQTFLSWRYRVFLTKHPRKSVTNRNRTK